MKNTYTALFYIFFIAVVAMGAYLRIHHLDAWGLWEDEHLTENRSNYTLKEIRTHRVTKRTQIFHCINSFNGMLVRHFTQNKRLNEFELRLPFAILGVISIIAIFFAGRCILNVWAGVFCSLLTALSYYHIYYSREARYYAVFFLASVWAIHATWKCIMSKTAKLPIKEYSLYAAASVFGLSIHQGFYFLFGILNIYLLINEVVKNSRYLLQNKCRAAVRYTFLRLSVVALGLTVPVLVWADVILKAGTQAKSAVSDSESAGTLLTFSWELLDKIQKDFWVASNLQEHIWIILCVCGLALVFSKRFHLFIIWIAVTLIPLVYFSRAHYTHFFHEKYIVFCYTASIMVVGIGGAQLIILIQKSLGAGVKKAVPAWANLHKKAGYILKIILLCICAGTAVYYSMNQLRHSHKYKKLFIQRKDSDRKLFSFLSYHYSSNDVVIVYEEPWRGPRLPDWIKYYVDIFSDTEWHFTRASKIQLNVPVINQAPYFAWWIMGLGEYNMSTPEIRKDVILYPYNGRLLMRSKEKICSRYEAGKLTQKLYNYYARTASSNKRSPVYGTISREINRWVMQDGKNTNYINMITHIKNSPTFAESNKVVYLKSLKAKKVKKVSVQEPENMDSKYSITLQLLDNKEIGELVYTIPEKIMQFKTLAALKNNRATMNFIIKDNNNNTLYSKKFHKDMTPVLIDITVANCEQLHLMLSAYGYCSNDLISLIDPAFVW